MFADFHRGHEGQDLHTAMSVEDVGLIPHPSFRDKSNPPIGNPGEIIHTHITPRNLFSSKGCEETPYPKNISNTSIALKLYFLGQDRTFDLYNASISVRQNAPSNKYSQSWWLQRSSESIK
jgi:hypothetical protein